MRPAGRLDCPHIPNTSLSALTARPVPSLAIGHTEEEPTVDTDMVGELGPMAAPSTGNQVLHRRLSFVSSEARLNADQAPPTPTAAAGSSTGIVGRIGSATSTGRRNVVRLPSQPKLMLQRTNSSSRPPRPPSAAGGSGAVRRPSVHVSSAEGVTTELQRM